MCIRDRIIGFRIDVHEHGYPIGFYDGGGRGDERIRRHDHLVAGLQAAGNQRQPQRHRTIDAVSYTHLDVYKRQTNDTCIATSLKFIHQNADRNLQVEEVVKQVPLSRRALEKRFLDITGYPVYKYIFNLRIEKFTQKLLETDMSIFEIALDMGLTDSKNIARQFRQIKGCTPIEYRNRYLAGK